MFKAVVGRGHQEFSSSRQQDAQEFFLHLLTLIDRKQHGAPPGAANPVNCFKFQVRCGARPEDSLKAFF